MLVTEEEDIDVTETMNATDVMKDTENVVKEDKVKQEKEFGTMIC